MKDIISLTIFKITLIIVLASCGLSHDEVSDVNQSTPPPSDIVQSSDFEEDTISSIDSDETCEIQLNGYSIHDMIQVFESPRFDLDNSIGGLSTIIGCVEDCPLLSMTVQGTMVMPQLQCEADKQTCGLWYQVEWKQYTDSIPISGWVSEQDEDIELVGDCNNLPMLNPETILTP